MSKLDSLIKIAFSDLILTNAKNKNQLNVDRGYHYTVTGKYMALPFDLYNEGKEINSDIGDYGVEVDNKNFNKKFNDSAINSINDPNNIDFKNNLLKEHKKIMNYLKKNKSTRFHLI
jgi:hypothetical protein